MTLTNTEAFHERTGRCAYEPSFLLNYYQVAFWLNVSESKLKKDVRMGRGPKSLKLGSLRRFRVVDVEQFVKEQADKANQTPKAEKKKRITRFFS